MEKMKIIFLILAGFAGGLLAGLGMGGGTLTIPILVLFLGVSQLTAQAVNLLSFVPTGGVALLSHAKNGMIETKDVLFLILPAVACCVCVSLFAVNAGSEVLRRVYGGFLCLVGIGSLTTKIIQIRKIGYLH